MRADDELRTVPGDEAADDYFHAVAAAGFGKAEADDLMYTRLLNRGMSRAAKGNR